MSSTSTQPPTGAPETAAGSRWSRARRRLHLPGGARLRPLHESGSAPALDHLEELRWRIVIVGLWFGGAFVASYIYRARLFAWLNEPLSDEYRIQTLSVTEPFFTSLSVAANAAFVLTFPILAWNLWRFVAPALDARQRRAMRPVLVAAPLLFFTGVAFCYRLVLGPAVTFLLGLGEDSFDVTVRAKEYYGFATMTMLAMGLVFLFPLVLVGLGRAGIVTSQLLRRQRRIAYVLMVIVAALLPTADPVSLAIEMLPLVTLYEMSIVLVRLQERGERRRAAATAATAGSDGDGAIVPLGDRWLLPGDDGGAER